MNNYTLDQLIIDMILDYPILYKDINYERSRNKVLNQLFFVIGNGLEWRNGVLVEIYDDNETPRLSDRKIPENYFDIQIFSSEPVSLMGENIYLELCSKHDLDIYPICKYSKICNIPNDIQDDFREGALEAISVALDFFNTPHKYMNSESFAHFTDDNDRIEKYIKSQKAYLYNALDKLLR